MMTSLSSAMEETLDFDMIYVKNMQMIYVKNKYIVYLRRVHL